jgi:CBS domain-containing protein
MQVSEIMTDEPITATLDTSIREVMELMYSEDIRHLPVVDGDQLVGIISDRDLRSLSVSVSTVLDRPEETAKRLEEPISTVMRGDVISVDSDASLDDLIDIMLETKLGAIPVVDSGTETLVGIASYIDVLEAARAALES